ncbi:MAG: DUF6152 family protein [Steroidobacteraceae bacterium]
MARLAPRLFAAAAVFACAATAFAHHSATMFDNRHQVSVSGTVRQFQWTNPHCWIELEVPTDRGIERWSIEMGSPADVFRGGWKPGTLKPGDRIRLVVHPVRKGALRNAVYVGSFVSATGLKGEALGARH